MRNPKTIEHNGELLYVMHETSNYYLVSKKAQHTSVFCVKKNAPEFRIETINGVSCMIFKSRL